MANYCLALWNNEVHKWMCNRKISTSELKERFKQSQFSCIFDGNNRVGELSGMVKAVFNYEKVINDFLSLNDDYLEKLFSTTKPRFDYNALSSSDKYVLKKLNGRHVLGQLSEDKFQQLICYCAIRYESFLIKERIDAVLFSEVPHTAYDYLFFLVSRANGVRNFACEMVSPIGRGCSYMYDMNNDKIVTLVDVPHMHCSTLEEVMSTLDVTSDTPYDPTVTDTYLKTRREVKQELLDAISNQDRKSVV